ncbi:MAG: amino acid-binding protein [Chloroflexi bacterium]|nr:amino acid-binding protein [Chloroflexota bacterium]
MRMKQVSVFIENAPGRLAEMLRVLQQNDINIRALSVADGTDFGIVRLILSDVDKGIAALRGAGLTASANDVLAADIPDEPGGLLGSIVEPLGKSGINLEYFYAFVDPTPGRATVVLKVRDLEKAEKALGM